MDSAFRFLAAFMMTKLKAVITDVQLFTLPQSSLKERGPLMAKTIPSVGLHLLFGTFSTSSAVHLKVFIPAALGSALGLVNTGAKVTILDIQGGSDPTDFSVFFTARHLKTIKLASLSRNRRGKQTPASKSASKRRKEDSQTSGVFWLFLLNRKRIFLPQTSRNST